MLCGTKLPIYVPLLFGGGMHTIPDANQAAAEVTRVPLCGTNLSTYFPLLLSGGAQCIPDATWNMPRQRQRSLAACS
jgi:hypothetical protein